MGVVWGKRGSGSTPDFALLLLCSALAKRVVVSTYSLSDRTKQWRGKKEESIILSEESREI